MDKKIIYKVQELISEEGIIIKDRPIINVGKWINSVIFEVDSEVTKLSLDNICNSANDDLGIKIIFNKTSRKTDDLLNVFLLTKNQIRKLIIYDYLLRKYDYLNYLVKSFRKKEKQNNKFINYKRIELILSNAAFIYQIWSKDKETEFSFSLMEIFLNESFLSENLINMISILIPRYFYNEEMEWRAECYEGIDFEILNKLVLIDPIDISKHQSPLKINKDIVSKKKESINNDELINYCSNKFQNFHDSRNYRKYQDVDVTRYSTHLEYYLKDNGIIWREFLDVANKSKFELIADQNLDSFLRNENHFERFVTMTFLNDNKVKFNLLKLMVKIMHFVDSEYKMILKPIVFVIEDFLIDLLFKASIELINIKIEKAGENIETFIASHIKTYLDKSNKMSFSSLSSIAFEMIQVKGSQNLKNLLPSHNDEYSEWKNAKHFVNSEKYFKNEFKITDYDFEKMSQEDIFMSYSKSTRLMLDLNYLLRKLSFTGIIKTAFTLDIDISFEAEKYDNLFLLKKLVNTFPREKLDLVSDIRNSISHQNLIVNSINGKVIEYEEQVLGLIEFMNLNRDYVSYPFQTNGIDLKTKNRMENKIYGLLNYFYNDNERSFKKLIKLIKFINTTYFEIYGWDLFNDAIDRVFSENKKNTPKQKEDMIFDKIFDNFLMDINWDSIEIDEDSPSEIE